MVDSRQEPAGSGPELVVVVPHHHRQDLLPACLAAVAPHPVVVVHDGPGPAPAVPDGVVLLRTTGDQGFARAVNRGLEHAEQVLGARRVLLLNDDAVPRPGCVERLLAAAGPDVGAVGPVVHGPDGVESAGIDHRYWGRVRLRTTPPPTKTAVDALSGACLLVPAWVRVDPAYPHGFEDLALCRDLRARGLRCLVEPTAACDHLGGATLHRTSATAQRHGVAGHLRLVGGGWRTPVVLGLAVAQVLREGGDRDRLAAVRDGWRDWRRAPQG